MPCEKQRRDMIQNIYDAKKPLSRLLVSGHTLSIKECAFLIGLYDRYSELSNCRDYRPLLDYYTVRDVNSESASRMYGVTLRCKKKIEVDLRTPELFVESFFVACLLSGDSRIAHADNERREHRRWVPNHTPQRDYTGLVYLNDNFTGGELVFADRNVVIIPKPGLLVGFPSNHKFVHAVPKVLSGKRYSLPVWFTVNPAKAMQV
jgi:2-oxoglutarate-Fe(II)-dependent oxygenase superfamily protein